MRLIASALTVVLMGCAGPGGPCDRYLAQEECPVGSLGWNAATNADAKAWERCTGYGLKREAPGWAQCMQAASAEYRADQRRDIWDERQARAAAFQAFMPAPAPSLAMPAPNFIQPPMQQPPRTVQTNCMRVGSDFVNCTSY